MPATSATRRVVIAAYPSSIITFSVASRIIVRVDDFSVPNRRGLARFGGWLSVNSRIPSRVEPLSHLPGSAQPHVDHSPSSSHLDNPLPTPHGAERKDLERFRNRVIPWRCRLACTSPTRGFRRHSARDRLVTQTQVFPIASCWMRRYTNVQ